MYLHGREIKFKFTIAASIEVSKMCKDGKLENIGSLFEGDYEEVAHNNNMFIIALHKGYIDSMKFEDPKFNEEVLTEEELLMMDNQEYSKLQDEAYAAYYGDSKRNVETEPVKVKGKKTVSKK
jgi:hypothetical protein